MKVKVLRSFGDAAVGDVVDVPEAIARTWIQTGRVAVVPLEQLPMSEPVTEPGVIEHAETPPDHREPEAIE